MVVCLSRFSVVFILCLFFVLETAASGDCFFTGVEFSEFSEFRLCMFTNPVCAASSVFFVFLFGLLLNRFTA